MRGQPPGLSPEQYEISCFANSARTPPSPTAPRPANPHRSRVPAPDQRQLRRRRPHQTGGRSPSAAPTNRRPLPAHGPQRTGDRSPPTDLNEPTTAHRPRTPPNRDRSLSGAQRTGGRFPSAGPTKPATAHRPRTPPNRRPLTVGGPPNQRQFPAPAAPRRRKAPHATNPDPNRPPRPLPRSQRQRRANCRRFPTQTRRAPHRPTAGGIQLARRLAAGNWIRTLRQATARRRRHRSPRPLGPPRALCVLIRAGLTRILMSCGYARGVKSSRSGVGGINWGVICPIRGDLRGARGLEHRLRAHSTAARASSPDHASLQPSRTRFRPSDTSFRPRMGMSGDGGEGLLHRRLDAGLDELHELVCVAERLGHRDRPGFQRRARRQVVQIPRC